MECRIIFQGRSLVKLIGKLEVSSYLWRFMNLSKYFSLISKDPWEYWEMRKQVLQNHDMPLPHPHKLVTSMSSSRREERAGK